MSGREDDPAYPAIAQAFLDGDPQDHQGGPLDVRAVVASLPRGAKDACGYDHVPWGGSHAAPKPGRTWNTCEATTPKPPATHSVA